MIDVLSMAGSLLLIVLVLVLTYYCTRWYARKIGKASSGKYIKVLDRTMLGTGAYTVIVQVNDRHYLLGVGDKQVSLLCELEGFEEQGTVDPTASAPFSEVLRQMVDKSKSWPHKKDGDDRRD